MSKYIIVKQYAYRKKMGCQTARRPRDRGGARLCAADSAVLANLLVQRGIDTEEKVHSFFNPQLSDLHDPFLMKDMSRRGACRGRRA